MPSTNQTSSIASPTASKRKNFFLLFISLNIFKYKQATEPKLKPERKKKKTTSTIATFPENFLGADYFHFSFFLWFFFSFYFNYLELRLTRGLIVWQEFQQRSWGWNLYERKKSEHSDKYHKKRERNKWERKLFRWNWVRMACYFFFRWADLVGSIRAQQIDIVMISIY